MLKFYWGGGLAAMTSDHLNNYILGITLSAVTEKLQLKIEGGGGQRTYF